MLSGDALDWRTLLERVGDDITSRGALGGAASLGLIVIVVVTWWWWTRSLERRRDGVPWVILVTGSRGKSSIVRLLHSVSREAGLPAYAKMTGTAAAEIDTHNRETPTRRLGPPSVVEMMFSLRRALSEKLAPQVIVMECMAVNPELVALISQRMIRPNIVVISNSHLDHLEDQGSTSPQIAAALSEAMRTGATVVTADQNPDALAVIRERAAASECPVIEVSAADVPMEVQRELPHAFVENIAIVRAVAQLMGIAEADVVAGIAAASSEPGENEVWRREVGSFHCTYVDLGAINDPPSLQRALDAFPWPEGSLRVGLLTGRWDRPLRALAFAGFMSRGLFDAVVVHGGPTRAVRKAMLNAGWPADRVVAADPIFTGMSQWRRLFSRVGSADAQSDPEVLVLALENEHDPLADRVRTYFHRGIHSAQLSYATSRSEES